MDKNLYWQKWRAERQAEGICISCGANKATQSTVRCTKCVEHRKALAKKYKVPQKGLVKKVLRERVFEYLGPKCACCDTEHRAFLTIDHVNRDGSKERTDTKQMAMFRAVLRGERPDIRILCYNCNFGREFNGGVCPHQR
jgi:hypothetical protein